MVSLPQATTNMGPSLKKKENKYQRWNIYQVKNRILNNNKKILFWTPAIIVSWQHYLGNLLKNVLVIIKCKKKKKLLFISLTSHGYNLLDISF